MNGMKPEVFLANPCPTGTATPLDCACSTQVIVDGEICIPPQKPESERIIEFRVSSEVQTFKRITTPLGNKLVVTGMVHIGLTYVASMPDQPLHYAHFDIPWHTFMLCDADYCDVTSCLEYADYKQLDPRCLSKLVLVYVCARTAGTCPPCPCPTCPCPEEDP